MTKKVRIKDLELSLKLRTEEAGRLRKRIYDLAEQVRGLNAWCLGFQQQLALLKELTPEEVKDEQS